MIRSRVRARGGIIQWFLSSAYKADSVSPSLILAFANNRYAANSSAKNFSDILTFSRASTATYFDANGVMQTAAADVPRFDCDPATGVAKGLLVEGARTNLLLSSGTPYTNWATTGATKTLASPSFLGYFTDGAVIASAGADWHRLDRYTIGWTSGTTYSWTVFCKAGTSGKIGVWFRDGTAGTDTVIEGTIGGSLSASSSAAGTATYLGVVPVGGGYIYYGTFTPNTTLASTGRFAVSPRSNVSGETVILYGAQLEAGSFPSSYIPTTSSAVTRSADLVSNSASNTVKFADWYNQSEGTFYAIASNKNDVAYPQLFSAGDGTSSELLYAFGNNGAGQLAFTIRDGGVTQASLYKSFNFDGLDNKFTGAYKLNDSVACTNGGSLSTDATCTMPTPTQLHIGKQSDGSGSYWWGYIKEFRYYNKRISNSELQRITNA